MKVVSISDYNLNLSESLLNELEHVSLDGYVVAKGAIALDDQQRLLPLISSFLGKQLDDKKISVETAKTYGRNLTYCLQYLMERREFKGFERDEAFLSVSRPTLKDYFKSIDETLDTKTLRNRDATLKAFFDFYLCNEGDSKPLLRKSNPYDRGMLTKGGKRKLIEACDLDGLQALMLCTDSERERLILQFMFDTGIRRSEVGRMTALDIKEAAQFQKAHLYGTSKENVVSAKGYFPIKIRGSKGRNQEPKPRVTLISAATLDRINAYHASPMYKKFARKFANPEQAPAFFNASGGRFGAKIVDGLLEKTSCRAINRRMIAKRISPHKLRHGYAYLILQSPDFGEGYLDRLIHVQKTLGHSQISTSEVYTRIPVDIYKSMTDEGGEILTRAQKMAVLTQRTKLKIRINDKK